MAKNVVKSIELKFVEVLLLDNIVWTAINGNGLPVPCFAVHFLNTSTTSVALSLDKTTWNEVIQGGERLNFDFQTQSQPNAHVALWQKGQIFYARLNSAATAGQVVLTGYYTVQ